MVKIGKPINLWMFVDLVNMDMDNPIKKKILGFSKFGEKLKKIHFIVKESLCDSFGD